MPVLDPGSYGAFVPTTSIYDPVAIQQLDVTSQEFKDFLVNLMEDINKFAEVMNVKRSGYYTIQEFLSSRIYYPNPSTLVTPNETPIITRNGFVKVVEFGALPNNTSKSVAHGIFTGVPAIAAIREAYQMVNIECVATDAANQVYIPVPYIDLATPANSIQIDVDDTNVTITTTADYSGYTANFIALEYIKN